MYVYIYTNLDTLPKLVQYIFTAKLNTLSKLTRAQSAIACARPEGSLNLLVKTKMSNPG